MDANINNRDQKVSGQYKKEVPEELIEEPAKKISNLVFLGIAVASILGSAALTAGRRKLLGNFVGLWVPTILTLGLYNKIVKLEDEILRSKMH